MGNVMSQQDREIRRISGHIRSVSFYNEVCADLFEDKVTRGRIEVWQKMSLVVKEQLPDSLIPLYFSYIKWWLHLYEAARHMSLTPNFEMMKQQWLEHV